MGRSPCCEENGLKKGPWTPEEDKKLVDYIEKHGHGSWRALPKLSGLNRCGKSCRLRWTNYLRPDIKRGKFSQDEEQTILNLHSILGNKWSAIATHLPGRTDNEIKNFWNTHLKKKLIQMGFDPMTHQPRTDLFATLPNLMALVQLKELLDHNHGSPLLDDQTSIRLQAEAIQLAKLQYVQYLFQSTTTSSNTTSSSPTDVDLLNMLNSSLPGISPPPPPMNQQQQQQYALLCSTASQPLHSNNNSNSMLLPPLCDPQQSPFTSQQTQKPTTVDPTTTVNGNSNSNNNDDDDDNNPEEDLSWALRTETSISNLGGGGDGSSSNSSDGGGGTWPEFFLDYPLLSDTSL